MSREQKDDNIIKLSFERDEKEKKSLSKLKRHDIILKLSHGNGSTLKTEQSFAESVRDIKIPNKSEVNSQAINLR